jgi:type VI secretion system protein ImpA
MTAQPLMPSRPSAPRSALAEVEPLLAPISETKPAGEWLRFDAVYDEAKRLREEDDPTLPQGVWQRELKRADWAGLAALCTNALQSRSKDLQIAAWLTEAWLHQHGFRGLERGLVLMNRLCSDFWNELFPALDEGSHDSRVSPIVWITEKLLLPIKSIPITAPTGDDAVVYAWRDWESGLYLANLTKSDAAAAASAQQRGMVPQAKFLVSVSLTPGEWLSILATDVAAAIEALGELDSLLTAKLGESAAPSLTPLREVLAAIHAYVVRVLAERVKRGEISAPTVAPAVQPPFATENEKTPMSVTEPLVTGTAGGVIASRAEAYQRLREAADFLMRTEPHSPVPYLVRRAVSWGNLSLAELLEELLHKNADLATIYTLLGVKKP